MEDKVIGPLTVRQFIIILVTVGLLMFANFVFIGPLRFLFFLAVFIIGGGGLSVAFFKYGDQNAEVFLLSAYKTFINPKSRVWKKEEVKPEPIKKVEPKKEPEAPLEKRVSVAEARSGLERLAEIVDTGGYSTVKKPDEAPDLLAKVERKDEGLEKIIDSASKVTPKREQLVSEMASLPPLPPKGETPHIVKRGEN